MMHGLPEPWQMEANRHGYRCGSCEDFISYQAIVMSDYLECRCVAYVPTTGERVYRRWPTIVGPEDSPPDPEFVTVQTKHGLRPVPHGTRRLSWDG